MKTKNIKGFISLIILLVATITTSAQESMTMHFMKGMLQSNMYNPALHNDSSAVENRAAGFIGRLFGIKQRFCS